MSEQKTGATTTTEETNNEQGTEFEPIASQDALDKIIQSRVARERAKFADYDDLRARAARADELESANLSELEKAQKAAADAEAARSALEAEVRARDVELLRQRIGVEVGLPAELVARLQGEDEESLRADAKSLAAVVPGPRKPVPNTWGRPDSDVSDDASFATEFLGS